MNVVVRRTSRESKRGIYEIIATNEPVDFRSRIMNELALTEKSHAIFILVHSHDWG